MNGRDRAWVVIAGVLMGMLGAGSPLPTEAGTIYVSPSGANDAANRYNTWEGAATSLNAAVAIAAGDETVLVTNGVYAVTTNLAVTGFTVQSVNGPGVTIVYRPSSAGTLFPIFLVNHSNSLVNGFSVTNGFWTVSNDSGGSVHMTAGTVSNCWIVNTPFIGGTQSGAVWMNGGRLTHSLISNSVPRSFALKLVGGTVENCLITRNTDPYDESPVRVMGGTMRRCRIIGNTAPSGTSKGPVWLGSGRIENSLIYGNSAFNNGSGGVGQDGGTMVNCTIANNTTPIGSTVGSGVNRTAGTITNCIIYGNSGSSGKNYSGSVSAAAYSCAPELPLGVQGNVNSDPKFVNLAAGDCHLDFGSPCVNAGVNLPGLGGDLEGTTRDAQCDMGAFERVSGGGPLRVGFSGLPLAGIGEVTSVFSAILEGGDTNITWWGWDFDNDGSFDQSGAGLQTASHTFGPGRYTVVVRAVNASAETAAYTNVNYVSVQSAGNDVYVATNGSATFPFDSWEKAAADLEDAFRNAAHPGSTVWIGGGAYGVTRALTLATNLAVRGANGPDGVAVYRVSSAGNFPIFSLAHAAAWVSELTLTNGAGSGNGGAFVMTAGTVSNCVMTRNLAGAYPDSVCGLSGGLVTHCLISNNTPRSMTVAVSGGILEDSVITLSQSGHDLAPVTIGYGPSGGLVRRCRIVNNAVPGPIAGAVQIHGTGRMENSLIWGNKAANSPYGAVMIGGGANETRGGTMVNCTVASNSTVTGAAGVTMLGGGTMTNCIVYGNNPVFPNYIGAVTSVWYSCAPEFTNSDRGNLTGDPLFVNLASGDCRLRRGSPCMNAGTNQAWMIGAVDLDGNPRIKQGTVDMGAYELLPEPGLLLMIE